MNNRVITAPATNVPAHEKSHVRGWSIGWAELLQADIDNKCSDNIMQYEKVYLDHGVNWSGSLNLFAGAGDEIFERFNRLMARGSANVISLDWEMPDYGAFLAKRLNAASTSDQITAEWCESLSRFCKEVVWINQMNAAELSQSEWLAWGDSHTPAFARMGSAIIKKDGRTMYGVVKNKELDSIEITDSMKGITLSLGSIDVRHHLMRSESVSCDRLMQSYFDEVDRLRDRLVASTARSVRIELCAPVPIETVERKIPKTGYFKKTPYYGERGHRIQLDLQIMKAIKGSGYPLISPPQERYMMDGEKYAKEFMELGGSVHMSPTHYRRYNQDIWVELNGS